jgi:hypothetical protein
MDREDLAAFDAPNRRFYRWGVWCRTWRVGSFKLLLDYERSGPSGRKLDPAKRQASAAIERESGRQRMDVDAHFLDDARYRHSVLVGELLASSGCQTSRPFAHAWTRSNVRGGGNAQEYHAW